MKKKNDQNKIQRCIITKKFNLVRSIKVELRIRHFLILTLLSLELQLIFLIIFNLNVQYDELTSCVSTYFKFLPRQLKNVIKREDMKWKISWTPLQTHIIEQILFYFSFLFFNALPISLCLTNTGYFGNFVITGEIPTFQASGGK